MFTQMQQSVIQTPEWLKKRMENVRKAPRPTFDQIRQQVQSSQEARLKSVVSWQDFVSGRKRKV